MIVELVFQAVIAGVIAAAVLGAVMGFRWYRRRHRWPSLEKSWTDDGEGLSALPEPGGQDDGHLGVLYTPRVSSGVRP